MRTTTVTCCRCREVIEAGASILEPTCGPLRRRLSARSIDLCQPCAEKFRHWLDTAAVEPVAHVA